MKSASLVYSQKKRTVRAFSHTADGRLAAFASEERHVHLIDLEAGVDRWMKRGSRRVAAVGVSPDGRNIAVSWSGKDGQEVGLIDAALGQERTLHTGHVGAVTAFAWDSRSERLATAGPDRSVRLWQVDDMRLIRAITKLPVEPRTLAFSPDRTILAVGDRMGAVRLLDASTGSERLALTGHLRDVSALAFSPDGRLLASASTDGTTRLWLAQSGTEIASLRSHSSGVVSVAFSPDGRTLATGGQDRKVFFWEVPSVP